MCLAIPGKIIKKEGEIAIVDFGRIRREISLTLTPSAKVGDFVLIHAGFSIQIVNQKDAKETLNLLKKIYE